MKSIKKMWEERGRKFGRKIEGVLPKSWPKSLNYYLDEWMWENVKEALSADKTIKVLDLGCGYGRLSSKVLNYYPKARASGIDLAKSYVDLYNNDLSPRGKALVGNIMNLPFKNQHFDVVFMVTTLMYLVEKKEQQKAINEIMRVLKKGGKFVIIERNPVGHSIINLFGLVQLIRGEKFKEIGSTSFSKTDFYSLIKPASGKINQVSGIPVFTLGFYFLFILSKIKFEKLVLKIIKLTDQLFGSQLLTLSLYIAYSGYKR